MCKKEAYQELRELYEALTLKLSVKEFFEKNKAFCKQHKITLDGLQHKVKKEKWLKMPKVRQKLAQDIQDEIKEEIKEEIKQQYKPIIESKFKELISDEELLKQQIKLQRARRAFGTIKDLYDDSDNIKKVKDLTDDEAALIAGIKVSDRFTGRGDDKESWTEKEFKFINQDNSMEALEKMLGMYEEDNKQKQPVNINLTNEQAEDLKATIKEQQSKFDEEY